MSDAKFKTFVERVNLYKDGDNPVFGDSVTTVTINDDAGGPYFILAQSRDSNSGELHLDFEEVKPLFKLLKKMIKECAYE
jgi:hypothetical protein